MFRNFFLSKLAFTCWKCLYFWNFSTTDKI